MIDLEVAVTEKNYATHRGSILQGLRLSVGKGEFVSIIGPSGAGKSTLLNIIADLDRDYTGDVTINGASLRLGKPETRCSFMFQEPRLMPWLTIADNIRLVMPDQADGKLEIERLLSDVELDGYQSAYPGELSGGMQRRAALARAFSIRPALLLMDEPFLSIDLVTANRLRSHLESLWRQYQPTVLLVTHDLHEALMLSDRMVFLSKKPAHVVKELELSLKRPRSYASPELTKLHDTVMAELTRRDAVPVAQSGNNERSEENDR